MEIREYENRAMAFRSPQVEAMPSDDALIDMALGIAGEAGQLAELMRESVLQGRTKLNPHKVAQKLGDVLWYLTAMADQLGLSLEDVMRINLFKLEDCHLEGRSPDGFPTKRSISRIK